MMHNQQNSQNSNQDAVEDKKTKVKIVVESHGGVITDVWCSDHDAEVTVTDWDEADDLRQDRKFSDVEEFEENYETAIQDLFNVW